LLFGYKIIPCQLCGDDFVKPLLGGGFNFFFSFQPLPGEMIQFDEHIFQMGWFNHQPGGDYFVNHSIRIPVQQPGFFNGIRRIRLRAARLAPGVKMNGINW